MGILVAGLCFVLSFAALQEAGFRWWVCVTLALAVAVIGFATTQHHFSIQVK